MIRIIEKTKQILLLFLIIMVAQTASAQCGYDVELTSNDLTIKGGILNTEANGPEFPQKVEWYLSTDGQVFSTSANFEMSADDYGDCSICADYQVTQTDGTSCSEIICKTITLVNPSLACAASFDYEDYDGPMPVLGGIKFNNFSTGPYAEWRWDFGDGNYDSESKETITHFYQESGTYEVRLSVWNGTPQDCYSEYTQIVDVYISDDPCDQLDCVWPGDTDGDGKATLEDLINIGVGFGMNGPPRETVTSLWEAQAAQDWPAENAAGVNYKHFDCNGDGTISIHDIPAIQNNYAMLENGISSTGSNGVPISLSFDVDTVVITEENQYLEVNAALNFGSSDTPMEEVYGVVLYLTYQKNYVVESTPVTFKYNDNSFLGDVSSVIPVARNVQEKGQTDIAMARRVPNNISGQGRVASLKFIIESDIIDGRAENDGEMFAVDINVVRAVDINGNEIGISLPEKPTGVFFQNGLSTTGTTTPLIDSDKIEVYPNPVNDRINLELEDDLHPESLELFNALGQRMIYSEIQESKTDINVSRLAEGIYLLKVQTEEGIGTKRVLIKR